MFAYIEKLISIKVSPKILVKYLRLNPNFEIKLLNLWEHKVTKSKGLNYANFHVYNMTCNIELSMYK